MRRVSINCTLGCLEMKVFLELRSRCGMVRICGNNVININLNVF